MHEPHEITIHRQPYFSSGMIYWTKCACGRYDSGRRATDLSAWKSGQDHATAKNAVEPEDEYWNPKVRYSWPVQKLFWWLQKPFDVEWTENPLSFPHCNTQAGCWMHYARNTRWCRCVCRWCLVARIIRFKERNNHKQRRYP